MEVGAGVEDPVGGVGEVFLAGAAGGCLFFEHGDGDAPGDLAGDVPIFEAFKVVDEDLFFGGGVEGDFSLFEMGDGGFGEAFDVDEPLVVEGGFDDGAAFVAVGDGVSDVFLAEEEALVIEVLEDFLAAFFGGEAGVSFASGEEHVAVVTDDAEVF